MPRRSIGVIPGFLKDRHRGVRPQQPGGGPLVVQGKSDFNRHLPVLDFSTVDVATGVYDLEPAHVVDSLGGLGKGIVYGLFDSSLRTADQFDSLIGVISHVVFPSLPFVCEV